MKSVNNRVNVHIHHTTFEYDSRIFKISGTLAEAEIFTKIILMGVRKRDLLEVQSLDKRRVIHRIKILSSSLTGKFGKIVSHIEWQFKLFLKILLLKQVDVIDAHSLSVLPLTVLLKKIKKAKLIYNAHELETETLNSRGVRKLVSKWLEKWLIGAADQVILVSDSIADWYKGRYKLENISVVKNIPLFQERPTQQTNNIKKILNIIDDDILFIYQGGIARGRNIEEILNLFAKANCDRHIVFIGSGNEVEKVKDYQRQFSNIHYLPAMPFEQLMQHTMGANVGIHLIETNCLNHIYCLPNKIFEYLHAGIPIFVRDIPELATIVKKNNCGWLAPSNFTEMLNFINQLTLAEINLKREQARKCCRLYSWENEGKVVSALYSNLFIKTEIRNNY
jgi:glycosyltransferase involved in cell wall biosynthesis